MGYFLNDSDHSPNNTLFENYFFEIPNNLSNKKIVNIKYAFTEQLQIYINHDRDLT